MMEKRSDPPVFLVFLGVLVLWAAWGIGVLFFGPLMTTDMAKLGQFGDLFGGVNALFTALAFAAVWWTGWMQRQELALQRKELSLQRQELADTRKVFDRQTFESTFFQQIQLFMSVSDGIRRNENQGSLAIQSYANTCRVILSQATSYKDSTGNKATRSDDEFLDYLIVTYKSTYDGAENNLGPYFRTLYHTFKMIDSSDRLNDREKRNYSNLIRAQLNVNSLTILLLNGLTEMGKDFKPLIERYGILKHLSKEDAIIRAQKFYLPTAFMGSEESGL